MGLPGVVYIKITTTFNEDENSASRTVQFLNGWGLNSLSLHSLGTGRFWHLDRSIISDTIELPDGQYAIIRKHVGPGYYDYKWAPAENDEDLNGY